MINGILCGFLTTINISITSLGELLMLAFLTFNIIRTKKNMKKTKEIKKFFYVILILILYLISYQFFNIVSYSGIIKMILKYIIIFITSFLIFQNLTNNYEKTIKFIIMYIISSTIAEISIYLYENGISWLNIQAMIHIIPVTLIFILMLQIDWFNKENKKYLLLIICVAITIIGNSRTNLVILLCFVFYNIFYRILQKKTKIIKKIISIISIIIILVLGINIIIEKIEEETASNIERTILLNVAIQEIQENFWFGVGPINYNLYAQQIMGVALRTSNITPHNYYIEMFAELGIIGFTILMIPYIPIIKELFSEKGKIENKYLIIYFLVFYMFNIFSNTERVIYAILLGMIYFYINNRMEKKSEE